MHWLTLLALLYHIYIFPKTVAHFDAILFAYGSVFPICRDLKEESAVKLQKEFGSSQNISECHEVHPLHFPKDKSLQL